jgi:photosystem II stability/assembly factor-like uncharacterized protein
MRATHRAPRTLTACAVLFLLTFTLCFAQEPPASPAQSPAAAQGTAATDARTPPDPLTAAVGGLRFRLAGPAIISGRIVGFAVDPAQPSRYFVAAASGGVWKTVNNGTTWTPVFDREGSYSIGYITLDPKNPNVVWVGSGENNSQRSVSYGDGVYRSDDGGTSWKNLGLKASGHIGKILIDPRDSNVVYVAAQGYLWGPGGDRGLYKTTDGGKSWKKALTTSENTGVTDVVLDPRNPDVLLAATWQRRRHDWTLIDGGPESAIHRSIDGGATWTRITAGMPTAGPGRGPEEMGRIGLAVAPSEPNIVYAPIEAANGKSGTYRSSDFGVTWERRSDFNAQAMYYAQVVVDPKNSERIYMGDVTYKVSDDGGRTVRPLGERNKHVDNHAIWIDPRDTNHYLVGCDGGIYETFDRAQTWVFKANLVLGQFYDVDTDNATPFYNVYGGTQDNGTVGGAARTHSIHGITNADWQFVCGGDGFHVKADPQDSNTIYCESQQGVISRFDKRTGTSVGIQPQPGKGEPGLRFNWDTPILVSPHSHTRIYVAANKVFRSDDRGDTWTAVGGDITRQVDRNQLPVMGKVWGPDAVAKNQSTAFYSNVTTLSESPKKEGLLYAGTDDGLIQVHEGGGNWRKVESFPGVPEHTYVSRVLASQHDAATVYAAFDAHRNVDFTPYLLKSSDSGKTWVSIKGNLPARGEVLAIAEDHVNPKLLFVGTEFGLYVTLDGGAKWIKMGGGLPTIAVRDIAIQKRENDLLVGTFGRGIYVLDDYTPLRTLSAATLDKDASLFPTRAGIEYIPSRQYGGRAKAFQGEAFFTADNPPFGAIVTYYLKESLRTKKERRQEAERGRTPPAYPSAYPNADALRAEAEEEPPAILITITDSGGKVIRTMTGPVTRGFQRVAWNLRYPAPAAAPPRPPDADDAGFFEEPTGPFVLPGAYRVTIAKRVDGVMTPLAGPETFTVAADGPAGDHAARLDFEEKVAALQRALAGATGTATATKQRIEAIKRALDDTPANVDQLKTDIRQLDKRLTAISVALRGDTALRQRGEQTPPSISERVQNVVGSLRSSMNRPTHTNLEVYRIAGEELAAELPKLRKLVEEDLKAIEKAMEAAGAPWTPGRIPDWKPR